MKKLGMVGVALAVTLTLTGCSAGTTDDPKTEGQGRWRDAKDGRIVYCLAVGHGMSCDWGNAKEKK